MKQYVRLYSNVKLEIDEVINAVFETVSNDISIVDTEVKYYENTEKFSVAVTVIFEYSKQVSDVTAVYRKLNDIFNNSIYMMDWNRWEWSGYNTADIKWSREDTTAYEDGSCYTPARTELYIHDHSNYYICHIPTYTKRWTQQEIERRYKPEQVYTWDCTGCWDMPLEAKTIDDAIAEFESIYSEKLDKTMKSSFQSYLDSIKRNEEWIKYRNGGVIK